MKLRAADGWDVDRAALSDVSSLVRQYHYSRSTANTATYCHGLFAPNGPLVGGCIWIPPTKNAAKTVAHDWESVLCLSRMVVIPGMPTNAASFLLGRSMRLIDRRRWTVLVTYADVAHGHTGAIYRATNWSYCGAVRAGDVWIHSETGEQRGRKRGPTTLTAAEMKAQGFIRQPAMRKHKFVHRVDP